MKSKLFGTVVAGAVAGLMAGGVAVAKDAKKADAGKCMAQDNSCAGHITVKTADGKEVKNACGGQQACKGVTEAQCKAANGKWEKGGAAPAKKPS